MKQFVKIAALLVAGWAQSSFAIVGVSVAGGTSTFKVKNKDLGTSYDIKTQTLAASVHLDPIPLVPISFGIQALVPSTTSNKDEEFKEFAGTDLSLEIKAWTPIALFNITPYAKVGYTVMGKFAVKAIRDFSGEEVKVPVTYDSTGHHIAIGLRYSPIPLFGLLLEYQSQVIELKPTESTGSTTVLGASVDYDQYKVKGEVSTILLGLDLKI